MRYERLKDRRNASLLLRAFYSTPWAIEGAFLPIIESVLLRWESGLRLSAEEIAEAVGTAPAEAVHRRAQTGPRGIAILPVLGILAQRSAGDASSAGTSTDVLRATLAGMMANDAIGAIVLDFDSPGGSVFGIQELADDIAAAAGQKKIVAQANSLMASAAFWIASAAEEIVVTPGAEIGSIGVIAVHQDHSAALEEQGIKTTMISAGKFKTEGNPFEELGPEAIAAAQSRVDEWYTMFVAQVAAGRNVSITEVRNGFGEGRTVGAKEAVKLGMADRIGTLDETIDRLAGSARAQSPRRARAQREIRIAEARG